MVTLTINSSGRSHTSEGEDRPRLDWSRISFIPTITALQMLEAGVVHAGRVNNALRPY